MSMYSLLREKTQDDNRGGKAEEIKDSDFERAFQVIILSRASSSGVTSLTLQ